MADPQTQHERIQRAIFNRKKEMIEARHRSSAFSPHASCIVDVVDVVDDPLNGEHPVFSVFRTCTQNKDKVLTLTNCTSRKQRVMIEDKYFNIENENIVCMLNSTIEYEIEDNKVHLTLQPYQVAWVKF